MILKGSDFMKKEMKNWLISAGICGGLFLTLIVLLLTVDVGYAVPHAPVGLSMINGFVFETIGENSEWENISFVLLIISVMCMLAQGLCIFLKMLRTKKLWEMIAVGQAWLLALVFYILFEFCIVNYRPILEEGELAASFPSSHTLIAVVLFGVFAVWLAYRLPKAFWKYLIIGALCVAALVSALARLMMGVHWLTDVLGGMLLGGMIVSLCGVGFSYLRAKEQGE